MTSGEDIAVEYTTEVEARSMSVPDSGEGSSGNSVGRGRVGEGGRSMENEYLPLSLPCDTLRKPLSLSDVIKYSCHERQTQNYTFLYVPNSVKMISCCL